MKPAYYSIYLTALFYILFTSCAKKLLEKPIGSDLNIDSVFSNRQKALGALANAYSYSLKLSTDKNYQFGTDMDLSGEHNCVNYSWEDSYTIQRSGMVADQGSGNSRSDDELDDNYWAIRQCYLVIENIDRVADITAEEKNNIKGEMKALIAYRYQEMFKRYGGLPLITKSLSAVTDNVKIPRSSLQETLDFIINTCTEAEALLPSTQSSSNLGRATKSFASAIKAEALIFAARPLFNAAAPYLSLGSNNKLICFENYSQDRWQAAADAAVKAINQAKTDGFQLINTGDPFNDYGNAVATPGNREVIMANRNLSLWATQYNDPHQWLGSRNTISFFQLQQYYKNDGTDQTWPEVEEKRNYWDYFDRIQAMEVRYKVAAMGAGIDAWNNPNDYYWSSRVVVYGAAFLAQSEGSGRPVKFYYKAGNRTWFNYPIYRVAEFYLDAAEAYNELGQPAKALEYINAVHQRAGLPAITETNKDALRKIIQREWAVEFYAEGHRYLDARHWKLTDIGNGIIGGQKKSLFWFYVPGWAYAETSDQYTDYTVRIIYTGFWNVNQYLNPFPVREVNKGYLIQNPGY